MEEAKQQVAKRSEVERIRAQRAAAKTKKPGPVPDDARAANVERLQVEGLRWRAIKKQMDAKTGVHRSIDAYQRLLAATVNDKKASMQPID
jgi:hypothetical protein